MRIPLREAYRAPFQSATPNHPNYHMMMRERPMTPRMGPRKQKVKLLKQPRESGLSSLKAGSGQRP